MKISNAELKDYYYGALNFTETEDGYIQAFQYTKQQMEYFERTSDFWYVRCMASTAKTIEFITSATKISFEYKFVWVGSKDSIELVQDGIITRIFYVKELEPEGMLDFELPSGEKRVTIYLPADSTLLIRNFEINDKMIPVIKNEKVLWMGDSITQGYGPLRSAHTYVSTANRILNYDIINQGIGGYKYDSNSLVAMEGYTPDKIIVAFGTNQYRDGTDAVEKYYESLRRLYPVAPVLCITPIWRGDRPEDVIIFTDFCNRLKEICKNYVNVTIVDGFELVPHLPEYFIDNLHPNALGSEIYGRNLVDFIRKHNF